SAPPGVCASGTADAASAAQTTAKQAGRAIRVTNFTRRIRASLRARRSSVPRGTTDSDHQHIFDAARLQSIAHRAPSLNQSRAPAENAGECWCSEANI